MMNGPQREPRRSSGRRASGWTGKGLDALVRLLPKFAQAMLDGRPGKTPVGRAAIDRPAGVQLAGIGSPSALRHIISTELHISGVPEAQIDAVAGHTGTGTNKRNYRCLRPDYLRELIAAVEDYWAEFGQFTTTHLRYQRDTNVIDLAAKRAALK